MVHQLDFKQRKIKYIGYDYGNEANTQNVEILSSIIPDQSYLILFAEYEVEIGINGEECQRSSQRQSLHFCHNWKTICRAVNMIDVACKTRKAY